MNVGMISAGLVFGLAAMGSGIGIGIVGPATVGAWKKCYLANKPAPMTMLAFTGNPLTQVFYGFLLMNPLRDAVARIDASGAANGQLLWLVLFYGLAAGIVLMYTAILQGKIAACACEAMAEKNQGFAQYLIIMGIAETVALFAMVFTMMAAGAILPNVNIPAGMFG